MEAAANGLVSKYEQYPQLPYWINGGFMVFERDALRYMENGEDVAANPTNAPRPNGSAGSGDPLPWYRIDLFNNMIVNNAAGFSGGGISLHDAVNARIALNTIARLFPDRNIVSIYCRDLVLGLGTLHCMTQQQPA